MQLLHGGCQHTDLFVAAVGGGIYVGEGLIDGEGLVAPDEQKPRGHQHQHEQHCAGGLRLLPAQALLERRDLPQRKAEDQNEQRQHQQKDARQILEDGVKELGVEVGDHVLAHADLTDGHEVAEDALVDQLHLGKEHLHHDKQHADDLPQDARQVRGEKREENAALQGEENGVDDLLVERMIDAQVQAELHIDAGETEQQQIAHPHRPEAAARRLRLLSCVGRFGRRRGGGRCVYHRSIFDVRFHHVFLLLRSFSIRKCGLRNLPNHRHGAYHRANDRKRQSFLRKNLKKLYIHFTLRAAARRMLWQKSGKIRLLLLTLCRLCDILPRKQVTDRKG